MIMTVNSTDLVARQRKVVDAFTRTLHALMAASFGLAYITSEMDGFRWLHAVMGYTLGTMFLIRLTWSVLGPRRVRLQSLAGRLAGLRKIHELIMHFQWQEILRLLLTVSVFSALIWTLPVLISGYATYFGWLGKWLKEIHETLANIMLLVVMCHIASVIILTVATDGQQIRPMLTGNVKGNGPDLVKHNLVSVGVALLLLVANFWSWQAYHWIHDPQFKEPPRWLHPVGGYVEENAD